MIYKPIPFLLLLLLLGEAHPALAQHVVLENMTVTTTETFAGTSVTAGPSFTIAASGQVAFAAESFVALRPIFSIAQGGTLRILVGDRVTDSEDAPELPLDFALETNYPNPFNPSTTIRYALPHPATVHLSVYDLQGRLVEVLADRQQVAGRYEVRFETEGLASGVYLYRLAAGNFVQTRHMVLLK